MEKELSFEVDEYRRRVAALQKKLQETETAGLIVTTPENIAYLCGHRTPGYYAYQAAIVPAEGEPVLIVRLFEEDNARRYAWIHRYVTYSDSQSALETTADLLNDLSLMGRALGMESDSWFITNRQMAQLRALCGSTRFVDMGGSVEALRVVKSPREIAHIRAACKIGMTAVDAAIGAIADGATENDLAAAALHALAKMGCEYWSAPPYICSGPRTALPHATWAGRRLVHGDIVYLSISGCVHRYSGVMMRSVVFGEPSPDQRRLGGVVVDALNTAIDTIAPGVTADHVDRACRGIVERAGFATGFKHRTGYSMGLNFPPDWGEGHILSLKSGESRVLQPGMTFHVVPLVFVEGKYGIGFGETVLVTDSGCEVLTQHRRELYSV